MLHIAFVLVALIAGAVGIGRHRLASSVMGSSTPPTPPARDQQEPTYLRLPVIPHTQERGGVSMVGLAEPLIQPTGQVLVLEPLASADAAPQPTEAQEERRQDAPPPSPPPLFTTYKVQPGDTVYGIARRLGIDFNYIVWNNPEISDDPDSLVVGQELIIPVGNGILYRLKLGDTLQAVALFFGVKVEDIVSFAANGITSPDAVREGMLVFLPGAKPPSPPEPKPAPAAPQPTPPPAVQQPRPTPPASVAAAASSGFIWPVQGMLTQYFGGGHKGLDIATAHGTPVVAAAAGQVVLVAYGYYGYGNYVIIRHANGIETAYAHLSAIYVTMGQQVQQGEVIGAIGCTGWCTGPHLHFEVHVNGVPVNPLAYLP